MEEIVGAIRRVSDIVAEISSATSEQSSGVSQVGLAVSQMDQVTQQNAALVEESAAAADSLRQQAQRLVGAVSVFKLFSQVSSSADVATPEPAVRSVPVARKASRDVHRVQSRASADKASLDNAEWAAF